MNKNIRSEVYELNQSRSNHPSPRSKPNAIHPMAKTKIFNIPLIAKRMNKVERYVRNFHNLTVSVTHSNRNQPQVQQRNSSLTKLDEQTDVLNQNSPRKYGTSVFLSEVEHKKSEKDILSGLLYTTLNSKDTLSKVNSLNRLQQSYMEMKSSMKIHHRLPRISNSKLRQSIVRGDQAANDVSQQQIESHIKSTMVEQEGKKYYGDLYLLKKGRDKILQSLQTIGKQEEGNDNVKPYEKIVHDVKNYNSQKSASEQHTKMKILQERQLKKNKMITNKHMHWNVYYDMMALTKHQKYKIQRGSRFGSRYGVD